MFLLLCSFALAGAFGLEAGTPIAALDHPVPKGDGVYLLQNVPKPNPEFSSYVVIATPALGVCKVVGIGQGHEGDLDGSAIRGVATGLAEVLRAKYGTPKVYDFLHAGSIWRDPGDFAMGLYLNQRTLAYAWSQGVASLPADLGSILLTATGPSSTTTSITLGYEFTIFSAYADARSRVGAEGL